MTYTEVKFSEAEYFYNRLIYLQERGELVYFTYNLSAFLSAARSIPDYIKEHNNKYLLSINQEIDEDKILKFVGKQRNVTVHRKKLELKAQTNADLRSTLIVNPKESINIELTRADNADDKSTQIIAYDLDEDKGEFERKESKESTTTSYQFFFNNWAGDESVLELCTYYLDWLQEFKNKW